MSQKKHKPEEIVAKLRQVDVLVSQGRSVLEAVRAISVTPFTYLACIAGHTRAFGAGGLYPRDECGRNRLRLDPEWTLPIHSETAANMADPEDGSGSQAEMAQLLLPLMRDGLTSPGRIAGLLAAGGTLRIGDLLGEVQPELVAEPAPAVEPEE